MPDSNVDQAALAAVKVLHFAFVVVAACASFSAWRWQDTGAGVWAGMTVLGLLLCLLSLTDLIVVAVWGRRP